MDIGHHLTWIVAAPALVAGVLALPVLFLPARWGRVAGAIILLALAVGYTVGFYGFHGRFLFPPRLSFHWLPILALGGGVLGGILALSARGGPWALAALIPLVGIMAHGLVPAGPGRPMALVAALLLPLGHGVVASLAPRRPSVPMLMLWAWLAFSFSGAALLLSGTARMAQLSGLIPCALLPLIALSLWRRGLLSPPALLPLLVAIHAAGLLIGWIHASLPAAAMLLLLASPAALALDRIRPIAALPPWVGACAVAAAVILIGGLAVLICLLSVDVYMG